MEAILRNEKQVRDLLEKYIEDTKKSRYDAEEARVDFEHLLIFVTCNIEAIRTRLNYVDPNFEPMEI